MAQYIDMNVINGLKVIGRSDPNFLKEMIDSFLASVPAELDALRENLKKSQAKEIGKVAHSLLSSAQNLGATPMADICIKLINLGRANSLEGAETLVEEMFNNFKETKKALEEILTKPAI